MAVLKAIGMALPDRRRKKPEGDGKEGGLLASSCWLWAGTLCSMGVKTLALQPGSRVGISGLSRRTLWDISLSFCFLVCKIVITGAASQGLGGLDEKVTAKPRAASADGEAQVAATSQDIGPFVFSVIKLWLE